MLPAQPSLHTAYHPWSTLAWPNIKLLPSLRHSIAQGLWALLLSPHLACSGSRFARNRNNWNLSNATTIYPDNIYVVVFCFVLFLPLYKYLVLLIRCIRGFFAWCYFSWSPESCVRPVTGTELWVRGIQNEILCREMTLIFPICSSRKGLGFFQIILKKFKSWVDWRTNF